MPKPDIMKSVSVLEKPEQEREAINAIIEAFSRYLGMEEAKGHLQRMASEKKEVKALMDKLSRLDRNSSEFVEWVLYGLLPYSKTKHAKRVSLFPAFMNIKLFFKEHNYSEQDWNLLANRVFDLCLRFQETPQALEKLIQEFSREKYSRNLQCGSITPILFCLDDRFPVVNNRVRHTYKSISRILGHKDKLSQKLVDYPHDIAKLKAMVEGIGLDLLRNNDHLDLFCWWYDTEVLQAATEDESASSEEGEASSPSEEEGRIRDIDIGQFLNSVNLDNVSKFSPHSLKNPDTVRVRDVVSNASDNKWVLPRFQRYFDWTRNDIRDFIESIFNDYYVGAILLWETKDDLPLGVISIKGCNAPHFSSRH